MEVPFIVGRTVRPPHFIDRETEMARLVRSLGMLAENQLLIAQRRMGKSSLLLNVAERIETEYPNVLTTTIDCRRITNIRAFADTVTTAVLEAYQAHHPVRGWLALKRRLWHDRITDVLPAVQEIGGSVGRIFSAYLAFRERALDDNGLIYRTFEFLQEFTEERQTGFVLILDEFQELEKLQAPFLFEMFKTFSDRLERVRFAFSGSSASLLESIFLKPNSPLYLMAGKVPLGPLDKDTVVRFLQDRFAAVGMTVSPQTAADIHAWTGGVPYYVQKSGHQAWLLAAHRDETHVSQALAREAYQDMLWELSSEFETRFEHKFGAQQKAILIALAEADGPVRRNELAAQTGRDAGSLSAALNSLESMQEIRKVARGSYDAGDCVFAAWLRGEAQRPLAPDTRQSRLDT